MEVLYPRCAGVDVHAETVVAVVRIAEGSRVTREAQRYGTTTRELLRLEEWLKGFGVTHVGMEATGVYWKPVWHVLEEHFALVLGNAREIRNVPGRKTDMNDATWLADLVAHGLIRSSFVPPRPIQELRDLTRTRKQMTRERGQHVQRLQKVLEDANVKLTNVLSDLTGASGRAILEAIVRGQSDPEKLASLASPRVKASKAELRDALHGRVSEHHRFMLQLHLRQVDAIDGAIELLEGQIERALAPFRDQAERVKNMPGMSDVMAATVIAEIGVDMQAFPSARHLLSWAGLSPQQNESAGKRKSSRTKRQRWLKTAMVQAAWAASRKSNCYYHAQFLRLRARRGAKKAVVAVAASMLTAVYHMLSEDVAYSELGQDYFHRLDRGKAANRLVRKLRAMGYEVDLRQAA
jgi:transposase